MEVDLAQENVISVAHWIHLVTLVPGNGPPPLPCFRVTPLVQSSFLTKYEFG